MAEYLNWKQTNITDFTDKNIENLYDQGYVLTRLGKGILHQTRSVRINLNKFELSSENKRILKKNEKLELKNVPTPYPNYDWKIHKLGKDFYEIKFGKNIFSANKIKEIFTKPDESNFDKILEYKIIGDESPVGFCIVKETKNIIHYSYPFYNLSTAEPNLGMGMMLKAILYAKEHNKKYIYLGSAQRPTDVYKLQFKGLEWYDGEKWSEDLDILKTILAKETKTETATPTKHIHFIGICGVAMSAIAIAFQKIGWRVTGSDVGFYPPISTHLAKHGIQFYPGWHPEKMTEKGIPDLVVVGNVAGSNNIEWLYTKENKLNYKSYPEILSEFFIKQNSLVCAGTYGKTSNSALLTWIFKKAELNPSYMFGGVSSNMEESAAITKSDWSIMEGDEYKTARWDNRAKFKLYSPTHALLTSASWDHADIYPTEESYKTAFKDLVAMLPKDGLLVVCGEGANINEVTEKFSGHLVKYGKDKGNDYVFKNVKQTKKGLSFEIETEDEIYKIETQIFGEFMAENICGCFAIAREVGIPAEIVVEAIREFKGMKRRMEKRYEDGITIYDDIAHSPTKAKSILETIKNIYPQNKIFAVFEPNTGNRQKQIEHLYEEAFGSADEVIIPRLTKVKKAKDSDEELMEGGYLAKVIGKSHPNAIYFEDDKKLLEHLAKNTKKNDVVVFLGSHSFRGMIEELINRVK